MRKKINIRIILIMCGILATLVLYFVINRQTTIPSFSDDNLDSRFQRMSDSVKINMTKSDVMKILGIPDTQQQINYKEIREIWKYTIEPDIRFQVNFNTEGKVVGQQLDAPKFTVD